MNEGWVTKPLGDVCNVIGGGTPPKDRPELYGGDIPWATVRDMRSDLISDTEFKITLAAVKSSATNIIPKNNVVIATRVGLGKVCLVNQDTAINQDLRAIIPKRKNELFVLFLFWWLKNVAHLIVAQGTGATVQGVKLPFIKSLPVPLPTFSEQQRIVAILDEIFAGLATATANAERNLKNTQELFDGYLNSILSGKSEGWVEKPIAECFKVRSGDFLPNRKMKAGHIDVYGGNGIAGKHNLANLHGTNVIIGRVGAKCGNVRAVSSDIWLTDNAFYVSQYYQPFDAEFLTYLLNLKNLRITANQAAQPVISYTTIKDVILQFPQTIEEQRQIVVKLREIGREIEHLEEIYKQKMAIAADLRQSILQKAFAGELTSPPRNLIKEAAE